MEPLTRTVEFGPITDAGCLFVVSLLTVSSIMGLLMVMPSRPPALRMRIGPFNERLRHLSDLREFLGAACIHPPDSGEMWASNVNSNPKTWKQR